MVRCSWCMINDIMQEYHDKEWGVPLHDDQKQFEFLMMEVMQCGLNWNMMMQKREIFRECFDNFEVNKIIHYDDTDIERIMNTEGMIRSERKVNAVIHNAKRFIEIQKEFGSFSDYIWAFSDNKTILYKGHEDGTFPAKNGLSDKISKDLKKRGFKYLGSVTVYSHLQACGIINDHNKECDCYKNIVKNYPIIEKRRYKEG